MLFTDFRKIMYYFSYYLFSGRTCIFCGIYFASKAQKETHSKAMHGQATCSKQRAKKIISRRETEVLCELEALSPVIEWVEATDLDILDSDSLIPETVIDDTLPVIANLNEWLISPFQNADC